MLNKFETFVIFVVFVPILASSVVNLVFKLVDPNINPFENVFVPVIVWLDDISTIALVIDVIEFVSVCNNVAIEFNVAKVEGAPFIKFEIAVSQYAVVDTFVELSFCVCVLDFKLLMVFVPITVWFDDKSTNDWLLMVLDAIELLGKETDPDETDNPLEQVNRFNILVPNVLHVNWGLLSGKNRTIPPVPISFPKSK